MHSYIFFQKLYSVDEHSESFHSKSKHVINPSLFTLIKLKTYEFTEI